VAEGSSSSSRVEKEVAGEGHSYLLKERREKRSRWLLWTTIMRRRRRWVDGVVGKIDWVVGDDFTVLLII